MSDVRTNRWLTARLIVWAQVACVVGVALLVRFPFEDPLWGRLLAWLALACVGVAIPALVVCLARERVRTARLVLVFAVEVALVCALLWFLLPTVQ